MTVDLLAMLTPRRPGGANTDSSFGTRYRDNTFELLQGEKTLIKERLPAVFDMHPKDSR